MGINGRLINKNLERKIKDMEVGEEGFAVPWALGFNEYKIPYLNVEFSIGKSPYGSRSMPIKRIGRGLADYDINLEFDYFGGAYKWDTSSEPFEGVIGVNPDSIVMLNYNSQISDKDRYPKTYEIRQKLTEAINKEDYELASKLRDEINKTDEPLK